MNTVGKIELKKEKTVTFSTKTLTHVTQPVDLHTKRNINTNKPHSTNNISTSHFEGFLTEFKGGKENVINILKIVLEQNSIEEFRKAMITKGQDNTNLMNNFIKNKYFHFVQSINQINESKNLVTGTDEVIFQLEGSIQDFLSDFEKKYIERIRKKDILENVKEQSRKLKAAYIFFGYLDKANVCLKSQQFESTIRLMHRAEEKYLKEFPTNSQVFKRGQLYLTKLKSKITHIIEEKVTNWLVAVSNEQRKIGETLYNKIRNEREKLENQSSSKNIKNVNSYTGIDYSKKSIRNTKNIVDNLLLIRNTTNLNYLMNKNSVLKSAVNDAVEEFDIINMVSNVDLNFLESSHSIYKKVDIDTKLLNHFSNFRLSQLQIMMKDIHSDKSDTDTKTYANYFSDILGYLILTLSIYELYPIFYPKRKFEEIIGFYFREVQNSINLEFSLLKTKQDFTSLKTSVFIFIDSLNSIGVSDRINSDPKPSLMTIMKEKAEDLNLILIQKYNNLFLNMLIEEKYINIEVHNEEEYNKYCKQYFIPIEGNNYEQKLFPFKLPYTMLVVEINENFKKYFEEIFEYVSNLFSSNEYEILIPKLLKHFLDKISEVFHTFSNFQEQDMNIILAAHICNNIKYIAKCKSFFSNYVNSKCHCDNLLKFVKEDYLMKTWENYEEIIFETLKNKIKQFIYELVDEDWLPEKETKSPHGYVESLISYLMVIYDSLSNLSSDYIKYSFQEALNYIPSIYFKEILLNPNIARKYNFYFIENLNCDINELIDYFTQINIKTDNLLSLRVLLNTFNNKKVDPSLFHQDVDIKIPNLIDFLSRYRNMKKSEMKGKISESDIASVVKKLKDIKK